MQLDILMFFIGFEYADSENQWFFPVLIHSKYISGSGNTL